MNKYPKFKKVTTNPVANVVTQVFAPDEGMEFATLQIRVSNDQPAVNAQTPNPENFNRSIRIWVTTETDIANIGAETATLIEPKAEIAPNGAYSAFGLTIGANERVYIRASGSGVCVRASALQHELAAVV